MKGSKYQEKIKARSKAAKAIGLPPNTPWPVIWAKEEAIHGRVISTKQKGDK